MKSRRIWLTGLFSLLALPLGSCGFRPGLAVEEQAATIVAASATAAAETSTVTPIPPSATLPPSSTPTPTETPTATPTPLAGGGRIAFVSNRTGQRDLYVILPEGSGLSRLTDSPGDEFYPAWSPEGDRLAFTYWVPKQIVDSGVFVMNADGRGRYKILDQGWNPDWSPDGGQIVVAYSPCSFIYCSDPPPSNLRVINPEGGASVPITDDPISHREPAWSPDGRWVATTVTLGSWPGPINYEIYLVDPTTGLEVRVTEFPGTDSEPSWSPDGLRIAFTSNRGGNLDIYLMTVEGGQITQLTDHPGEDGHPTWSPDGRWIAFASERDGNFELYLLEIDTGALVRLTDDPADDVEPDWSR